MIALIYFGVAQFSLSFLFEPEGIAAIWPPSGIFLSALLLIRRNIRPYLIAALFLTDLAAEILAGIPPVMSLVYSAVLTGDAVLGAWLYRRFVGELPTFRQVRQVIGFLLLCILLSNALTSAAAALAVAIWLRIPFWSSWLRFWSTNGVGSLLVTPLIISLAFAIKTRFAEYKKSQFIEGAVLFLLMAFLSNYAFSHLLSEGWFLLLLNILVFPFLIWASLRFGVLGAALTSVILTMTILQYAIVGSFAQLGVDSNLKVIIIVQVYIGMVSIPSILLAALITERKRAEIDLRQSEAMLQEAQHLAHIGHWYWDITTNQLTWSDEIFQIFGVDPGTFSVTVENFEKTIHPDDLASFLKTREQMLAKEMNAEIGHRIVKPDGEVRHVVERTRMERDGAGRAVYVVGTVQDITERKQQVMQIRAAQAKTKQMLDEANLSRRALLSVVEDQRRSEQELKTSEKRFRDVTEYAQEWIWEVDAEGFYVYASRVVERILGYTPEEILQKHFHDFFHPDDRESLKSATLAAFAAKQPFREFINRNVHKNGQTVWIATSGLPLLDDKGNLLGYRGADTDITERKRAEEEITKQIAELQRWNSATLGREMRILDLKREVNELLDKAGQPPRYTSAES